MQQTPGFKNEANVGVQKKKKKKKDVVPLMTTWGFLYKSINPHRLPVKMPILTALINMTAGCVVNYNSPI